jgi:hypothetical protein
VAIVPISISFFGGVVCAGTAQVLKIQVVQTSGGVVCSGVTLHTIDISINGGAVVSGNNENCEFMHVTASGGSVAGGIATVSLFAIDYVASGGAVSGGTGQFKRDTSGRIRCEPPAIACPIIKVKPPGRPCVKEKVLRGGIVLAATVCKYNNKVEKLLKEPGNTQTITQTAIGYNSGNRSIPYQLPGTSKPGQLL